MEGRKVDEGLGESVERFLRHVREQRKFLSILTLNSRKHFGSIRIFPPSWQAKLCSFCDGHDIDPANPRHRPYNLRCRFGGNEPLQFFNDTNAVMVRYAQREMRPRNSIYPCIRSDAEKIVICHGNTKDIVRLI